ncbi:MAG: D-alanine--D-alanine ligase family protein [Pseudomonadota bacterium]
MSVSKRRLAVLFGGRSAEHEVSVSSARAMLPHVDRERFDVQLVGISKSGEWLALPPDTNVLASGLVTSAAAPRLVVDHRPGGTFMHADGSGAPIAVDVVFPLLHGPFGEDGTVQGVMELAGIPTVGCGVAASAVAMDKELTKRLCKADGLPQVDYHVVRRSRWEQRPEPVLFEIEGRFEYPVFVKPARMGSSVGVSAAHDRDALAAALTEAARFDTKMIVETAASGYREIECAVLGNAAPEASVVGEIVPANAFYDYQAKYADEASKLIVPAELSEAASEEIRTLAVAAFRAVGASGLARVDFFVHPDDESVLVNEVNTMPGFTPISMYPRLWEASGIPYSELITRLIDLACERAEEHRRSQTSLN